MSDVSIVPYGQAAGRPDLQVAINSIFFESSATQTFEGPAARAAFHERWLGRYLDADAAHAWLAIDAGDRLVGYLVGCLGDPATIARFADLPAVRAFASFSARYPAHLHVNLTAPARGAGIGKRLIEAFVTHAKANGAAGAHVVTGTRSRNVSFYRRCDFEPMARHGSGAAEILFLGRKLV